MKSVGVGAVIGAMVLVGALVLARSGETGAQPDALRPAPTVTRDVGAQILAEAKELFAVGDFEGAHERVQQIPEGSPSRDDPAFKDIEAKWAESIPARVDALSDPAEKSRLLRRVMQTVTVHPEIRRIASTKRIALEEQPEPAVTAPPDPPATATPPPSTSMTDEAMRARLLSKAATGKASKDELLMLRAVCRNLGDGGCLRLAERQIDLLNKPK